MAIVVKPVPHIKTMQIALRRGNMANPRRKNPLRSSVLSLMTPAVAKLVTAIAANAVAIDPANSHTTKGARECATSSEIACSTPMLRAVRLAMRGR